MRTRLLPLMLFVVVACALSSSTSNGQLLIQKDFFSNPPTRVLNKTITNLNWGVDFFCTVNSTSGAYMIELDPVTHELTYHHVISVFADQCWSGVTFIDDTFGDQDGFRMRRFGTPGTALNEIGIPSSAVVVAPASDANPVSSYYNVYYTDIYKNRVERLRYRWTTPDSGLIHVLFMNHPDIYRPIDIDVSDYGTFDQDWDDIIWVACRNNKIMAFNQSGYQFISYGSTGSGTGQFNRIEAIICGRTRFNQSTGVWFGNNNFLYVLDAGNGRIVQLERTTSGMQWRSEYVNTFALSDGTDLEIDVTGNLWVLASGVVHKFAIKEGNNMMLPLDVFGSEGTGPNQFDQPVGIANAGGHIGFGEMNICEDWNDNSGLQRYVIATDVKDLFVNTFPYQGHCAGEVLFSLIDVSQLTVKIFNSSGVLVKTLHNGLGLAGYYIVAWDGRNSSGIVMPGGQYRAEVRATSKYTDSDGLPVNQVTQNHWFNLCEPQCTWLVGDADGNGIYTISDAVYLITYIFGGGPAPTPNVIGSGDADCSTNITISDPVYLISFVFGGGNPPQCACSLYLK